MLLHLQLIALLNFSVLGFSFVVFQDKAKRTQQGNPLDQTRPNHFTFLKAYHTGHSSHGPFYANLVLLATVLVRRDVSKTLKCWWTAEGEMSNIYCMSPSAGIGVVNI